MARSILLGCGIVSSLVYVLANVVAPLRWEGYSTFHQAVSELSALGAPSRPVMVPLLVAYSVLALAFAIGVLRAAGTNRALHLTGWALLAVGIIDVAAPLFPMHVRGTEPSLTDTLHVAVTALNVLPIFLAIGFSAAAFRGWFRTASIVTLVVIVVFGTIAGMQGPEIAANLPTPWHGVYERINIGGYLLWMAVLAVLLLRRGESAGAGSPPTPARPGSPMIRGVSMLLLLVAATCGRPTADRVAPDGAAVIPRYNGPLSPEEREYSSGWNYDPQDSPLAWLPDHTLVVAHHEHYSMHDVSGGTCAGSGFYVVPDTGGAARPS